MNNEQVEFKIKNTIPFTLASPPKKKPKYFSTNLNKIGTKFTAKTMMKKILNNLINGEIFHVHEGETEYCQDVSSY